MILKYLSISNVNAYAYGAKKAPEYRCEITFQSDNGEIKLNLPEDTTKRILAVVADLVAEAGRETARNLTAEVIENIGQAALTHESNEEDL